MKEKAYYETINVKNEVKLRKLLETLPPFCKQFFIGIEATSSSRTKIAYAYDIGCFFDYLHATNPVCAKMDITSSFFQAEDGIRDDLVTGVQTCALPI